MKCYVCAGDAPIDGQVILIVGAMEAVPNGACIPESPSLLPNFSVDRHDHRDSGNSWDMSDLDEHQSANGQADVHFCSAGCLEMLFRDIVAKIRSKRGM